MARLDRLRTFLKAGLSLLGLRLRGRQAPWYVNLFITSSCNLRCSYCYVALNQGRLKEPTLAELCRWVDELHAMGTRYLCLLGGEPLVRADLPQLIDYILAKDMLVSLNTNGTIGGRHLDALKKVHRIAVSLEGDEATHDADRGPGTYAKAIATLKWLRENDVKGVAFQTTISAKTRDSWNNVLEVARDLGASVLFTEIACGPGQQADAEQLDPEALHRIWQAIRDMKQQGYPVENSFQAIDAVLKLGRFLAPNQVVGGPGRPVPPELKDFDTPCPMGRFNYFLNYDMATAPCASLFNEERYDGRRLGLRGAWEEMAGRERCRVCRMRLNYQSSYLFSSFSPMAALQIAMQAMKSYHLK